MEWRIINQNFNSMETKKCPFCGEEILAEAKKCKHCGEWLDKTTEIVHEIQQAKKEDDDEILVSPFSELFLKIIYWVAIFGLIISGIHDIMPDGETLSTSMGSGRTRMFSGFLNMCLAIPDWVGMILEGGAAALLLYSLKDAMSCMKHSFEYLFINLIAFTVAFPIMNILSDFMEDSLAMWGIQFSCLIGSIVCVFVLGVKLSTVYHNELKKSGIVFIICSCLQFVTFIVLMIEGMINGTEGGVPYLLEMILIASYWAYYATLKNIQI